VQNDYLSTAKCENSAVPQKEMVGALRYVVAAQQPLYRNLCALMYFHFSVIFTTYIHVPLYSLHELSFIEIIPNDRVRRFDLKDTSFATLQNRVTYGLQDSHRL
jgi:hypothetical protein